MLLLTPLAFAVASMAPAIDKPHLHGIFVGLTSITAQWTDAEWQQDLQAMADIGLTFFVIHHSATGSNEITTDCPLGTYTAYFPMRAPCFSQIGSNASGGSIGVILRAAKSVGLRVHLGLAAQKHLVTADDKNALYVNATTLGKFRELQSSIARALWSKYASLDIIDGFYTYLTG